MWSGFSRRWQADKVIIEYANSGVLLLRELRLEHPDRLLCYKPLDDKQTRLAAQTAKLETGTFRLPARAEWLAALRHELLAFPNGRHDDQVDCLAQFLDWTGFRSGRAWQECHLNGGRRQRINRPDRVRRW